MGLPLSPCHPPEAPGQGLDMDPLLLPRAGSLPDSVPAPNNPDCRDLQPRGSKEQGHARKDNMWGENEG